MSWTHEAQPREMIILWNPLKICLLSISFQIDNKELLMVIHSSLITYGLSHTYANKIGIRNK